MAKRVLIVTNSYDLHADLVSARLSATGQAPFRLNLDDFPKDYEITLSFVDGRWSGGLTHLPTGNALLIEEIGAVWMRKKADFNIEDRIVTHYKTDSRAIRDAVHAFGEYVKRETLTTDLSEGAGGSGSFSAETKIEGETVQIAIRQV